MNNKTFKTDRIQDKEFWNRSADSFNSIIDNADSKSGELDFMRENMKRYREVANLSNTFAYHNLHVRGAKDAVALDVMNSSKLELSKMPVYVKGNNYKERKTVIVGPTTLSLYKLNEDGLLNYDTIINRIPSSDIWAFSNDNYAVLKKIDEDEDDNRVDYFKSYVYEMLWMYRHLNLNSYNMNLIFTVYKQDYQKVYKMIHEVLDTENNFNYHNLSTYNHSFNEIMVLEFRNVRDIKKDNVKNKSHKRYIESIMVGDVLSIGDTSYGTDTILSTDLSPLHLDYIEDLTVTFGNVVAQEVKIKERNSKRKLLADNI